MELPRCGNDIFNPSTLLGTSFAFCILHFDLILGLTPIERWEAARRFNTGFVAEHFFLIAAMTALTLLVGLLLWVSYTRVMEERKMAKQLFFDQAEKRGLSTRERQILLEVVGKSRLKQSDAIFTMQDAFDRGAAELIEQRLASQRPAEEIDQLRAELSFLREKLAFQPITSIGSATNPKKLSSRQIPIGKTIHVTRRKARISTSIESTVLKNDEAELVVKLAMPVQSRPGEYWRARYDFGASVLEFDTSVISCTGDILVFSHSENIRFISRRRFLRVPVNRPALIAPFPFARIPCSSAKSHASSLGEPEFVPAVVTELAGPGLRLEAPLQVKIGDRVLVILALNEQQGSRKAGSQNEGVAPPKAGKTGTSKIVQDIGMVRHTKAIENGLSIAVELVGLSDSDVNELIRATNAASPKRSAQSKTAPASTGGKQIAGLSRAESREQELAESSAVQGL